jgi:hypothetical protein
MYLDSSKALAVISRNGKGSSGLATHQDGSADGLLVQLAAAGSDVATVAPLLELQISSSRSSSVRFAVIGLTNMLNPGGAVENVSVSSSSSRSSSGAAGSDGGSSQHSSDSWVVADAGAGAAGDNPAAAAAGVAVGAPEAAAAEGSASVCLSLLGCGQLLLYASCKPAVVLLDGQAAQFDFDSSSCSLLVEVPEPAAAGSSARQPEAVEMQHDITFMFV